MNDGNKKYWYDFVTQMSIASLGQRMFVIEGERDLATGKISVHANPVVGLFAMNRTQFVKSSDGKPRTFTNVEAFIRDGWLVDEAGTVVNPVVVDHEGQMRVVSGGIESNQYRRVVVCLWPENEDERRLAAFLGDGRNKLSTVGSTAAPQPEPTKPEPTKPEPTKPAAATPPAPTAGPSATPKLIQRPNFSATAKPAK